MAYTPQIYYPSNYQPQFQSYQPMQQPMQAQPQPMPAQSNNQGLIWVSGEVGAKSYLMTPNSTVMLMDSESSKFYIKSTDSAGMPTIRTYEYTECSQNVPQCSKTDSNSANEQFVTRKEYEAIWDKYEEIEAIVAELQKPKPAKKKVEVSQDE